MFFEVFKQFCLFIVVVFVVTGCNRQNDGNKLPDIETSVKGLTSEMIGEKPITYSRSQNSDKDGSVNEAPKIESRSPEAISAVTKSYNAEIQNCYKTAKLIDATLQGKVKLLFVISPSGDVLAVKFVKNDWTDVKLGGDVEVCITKEVKSWKFSAIDENSGNVTAAQSYSFE